MVSTKRYFVPDMRFLKKLVSKSLFLLIMSLAVAFTTRVALSAVAGLPFTEDFVNNNLLATPSNSAQWTEREKAVLQAFRQSIYGGLLDAASLAGTALGVEEITHAVAIGDVDGDGNLDLVLGNIFGATNKLLYFRNDGTATPFSGGSTSTFGSNKTFEGLALADIDNDGDLDLIAAATNANELYVNNGNATTPFSAALALGSSDSENSFDLAVADMDGDGLLDVVVANADAGSAATNKIYYNDGDPDPYSSNGIAIGADADNTQSIAVGDIDGDGLLDVVVGNRVSGFSGTAKTKYHLNQGAPNVTRFGDGSDISSHTDNTESVALGDMDNDGDLDVLVGNNGATSKLYFNGGSGNLFSSPTPQAFGAAENTFRILAIDLNHDGFLDAVTGNLSTNKAYINNGSSTPLSDGALTIGSVARGTLDLAAGDIDADGDLDLIEVLNGFTYQYLNTSSANPFLAGDKVSFTGTSDFSRGAALADMDGDGDLDIVTGNSAGGTVNALFVNDGDANPFSAGAVALGAESELTNGVAVGDVNGDGHLDVVTATQAGINRFYRNNGTTSPFSGVVVKDLGSDSNTTISIALADMNGDGLLDAVASNTDDANYVYLNNGDSVDPFTGIPTTFGPTSGSLSASAGLAIGDVDKDGDMDIVIGTVGAANQLYLNNGDATFAPGTNAGTETDGTNSVGLADMDGDGYLDIVAINAGTNRLYLNDGSATPFSGAADSDIGSETDTSEKVDLVDVDQDGDIDVLVGNNSTTVPNRLYLNNGTETPFLNVSSLDITNDKLATFGIEAGDIDQDGDLDIVVANFNAVNNVYLNDGSSGIFGAPGNSDIGTETDDTRQLAVGDVDNDGDLDVVSGIDGRNRLYLNNGSSDPFSDGVTDFIGVQFDTTNAVMLADFNQDGNLDLITGNSGANRLYLGDGDATPFGAGVTDNIGGQADTTNALGVADVDSDGDLDIIAANNGLNRLYLNNSPATPFTSITAANNLSSDAHNSTSVVIGDINQDGLPDAVVGNIASSNRLYANDGVGNPYSGASTLVGSSDAHNTNAVALGDLDNDGDLDVVAGNSTVASKYYLNNSAVFPASGVDINPAAHDSDNTLGIAIADMNQDGNLDVVVANNGVSNKVYYGDGDSTPFSPAFNTEIDTSSDNSQGVVLADVDRDGRADVLFANNGTANTHLSSVRHVTSSREMSASAAINSGGGPFTRARLTPTVTAPDHARVRYYLSNNGGTRYYQVVPGQYFDFSATTPPSVGSDLRWKAEFDSISPVSSARLSQVVVTINEPPVFTTPPQITGTTLQVGDQLTCAGFVAVDNDPGDTLGSPSYEWFSSGSPVGTNSANYTLLATDAHDNMRCDVTIADQDSASTTEPSATVLVLNSPPLAGADTLGTAEDVGVVFHRINDLIFGTGVDTDADGDSLTVIIPFDTTSTAGSITGTSPNFLYTPPLHFNGPDTFDYTVDDGNGGTDIGTVTINVTPVDDLPTITGTPDPTILPGVAYSFTPGGGDVDGDTLTYAITNPPVWASVSFSTSTGALTGTPLDSEYGTTNNINISVDDGTTIVPLGIFSISVLDSTNPTATDNHPSGDYNTSPLGVNLFCSDGGSGPGPIFYTTTGASPPNISYGGSGSLVFASDTNLDYRCQDIAGNFSNTISRSYNIDTVPPVPVVDNPGGVFNAPRDINSMTCTDDDTGGGTVYFTINGTPPAIGTNPFTSTVTIDQSRDVKMICEDNAGNVSAIVTESYIIDQANPTALALTSGGNFNTNQSVALQCNDTGGSGAGTMYYTDDGTDPTNPGGTRSAYSIPIDIIGPASATTDTQLRFYCEDLAGNSSATVIEDYKIDKLKPVNGATPAAGSFSTAPTVTLLCNDETGGSGEGSIFYGLDGAALTNTFITGLVISSTTTISHYCLDLAGNSSDVDDRVYTIDSNAPTISVSTPTDEDNYDGITSIAGTANDNSAVASVEIEISGASGSAMVDAGGGTPAFNASATAEPIPAVFTPGNPGTWTLAIPFNWPADVYTVVARVKDDADNINVDTINFSSNRVPTISGTPSVTSLQPGVLFSFTPSSDDEDLSFGDSLTFSIQDQPGWAAGFNTATGELSGTPADGDFGTYSNIIITTTDEFGETASLGSFTLNVIDTTAPIPDVDVVPGSYNSNIGITLSCNDSGSMNSTIYFTTNGTDPVAGVSPTFTTPIVLAADTTIKYICRDSAGNDSTITTLDYVFDQQAPLLTVVNPPEGDFINVLASITGTAGDDDNLESVELEIVGASGSGMILSGGNPVVSPGTPPEKIPATLNGGSWSLLTPNWIADDYTITATATDSAGNENILVRNFTFFLGDQAFTTLTLDTSSPSILNGETIDVTGKLTRSASDALDLSNLPIDLEVTDPNGTVTTFNTVTSSQFGHYQFLDSQGNAITGFNIKGEYSLTAKFVGNAALSPVTTLPVSVLVGTSAGYAVVVQGKIGNEEGLASHNKTTNRIYNTLLNRGFDPANILYYNYDDSQSGVDGLPSKATVQNAIENLLPTMSTGVAAPVYLFMVDHGSLDLFHIGADTISATEFNGWMTTMEGNFSDAMKLENRFLVYGACYSGSYIPTVSKSGRVIVASAAFDEESYKGPIEEDGVRVGEFFIEEFMKQLERGNSFKGAFNVATEITEIYTRRSDTDTNSNQYFDVAAQHPLLDDNGDGIGSNLLDDSSADGGLSEELFLGVGPSFVTNSALNPADLEAVAETSFLDAGSNSITLSALANSDADVSSAWFEVRKPNKVLVAQGGSIQLEVDLDKILMTLNSSTTPAQWEGTYSNFDDSGTYEVFYYVKDSDTGVISPTKRSVVYKQKSGNQAPPLVQLIAPLDGSTEKTILVFDWSTVQDSNDDNLTYTLEIATDTAFTTGSMVAKLEDLEASGAIIDDLTPIPDLTPLFWRVKAIDQFGAASVSAVNSFDTDNTNGIPGVIQGLIFSNQDFGRLQGANVTTDLAGANVAITEFNGNFILLSDEGTNITLQISSDSGEFVDVSVPGVTVVAGKSTEVNVGVAADTGNTPTPTPTPTPDPDPTDTDTSSGGSGSMDALFIIWLMLIAGMWKTAAANRFRLLR